MSIDSLKSLLNDFDPTALIPSVDSLTEHLPGLVRLAIQLGPLVLLVFGVIYLFFSPKEANYSLGFRCYWGMSSVDSWQFTQFVAGASWSVLGLMLLIWAAFSCRGMDELLIPELLFKGVRCVITEFLWILVSVLLINLLLIGFFDFHGNRRPFAEGLTLVPDFRTPVIRLFQRAKAKAIQLFQQLKAKVQTRKTK